MYIIHENDHNVYDDPYETRINKMVACIPHQDGAFIEDLQKVWSLLSQYVGEVLDGKTICDRYRCSKDGRQTWHDLLLHFDSTAYKSNLAMNAKAKIKNAHYSGERGNFMMTTYHIVMLVTFNDLEEAGRGLSERQKIDKFMFGVNDHEAIQCCQTGETELKTKPSPEQTFTLFYNLMNGNLQQLITLTNNSSSSTS